MADSTQRFSSRVENYVKYRPAYPAAVIGLLKRECGLTVESAIADLGSGTGILAELFLLHGNQVYGVEPNREMREAGERLLAPYPCFQSVNGTAEATTLPTGSVDFVTAGQAFHWFDGARTRVECQRILAPMGWAVLIWNDRRVAAAPFLEAYERLLLTYGTDYASVNHTNVDAAVLRSFFGPAGYASATFDNRQIFDFDGLRGRLLSSSYAPEAGHPAHAPMLEELQSIFDANQSGGTVAFDYDTRVFYGHLAG